MPQLILIRGLPGSGKSTLAKTYEDYVHIETDMFFEAETGEYQFQPELLKEGHQWCLNTAKLMLEQGFKVIVSNTFTQIWELQPYLDLGYKTKVIECHNYYGNVHGVPEHTIQNMKNRWEVYDRQDSKAVV